MIDKLREKLIHAGRVIVDEGQGDYVWGHISARLPDNPGRFLMKPGCVGIEEMTDDNIITCDIEGEKTGGDWPRHNEVYIHSEVMRARADVMCVITFHDRAPPVGRSRDAFCADCCWASTASNRVASAFAP